MIFVRDRVNTMTRTGTTFSTQLISAMQSRFNKKYKDRKMQHFIFDLPSGIKVESRFINPITYTEMADPLSFTKTKDSKDPLHLPAYFGLFCLLIVDKVEEANAMNLVERKSRKINANLFGVSNSRKRRSPSKPPASARSPDSARSPLSEDGTPDFFGEAWFDPGL